ncbi:DUF4440 domain-containing protein [Streptosporangium soli]|nr:DUF4440 domain-containing protein [Streptosporangium sp. KLBMP 9127]
MHRVIAAWLSGGDTELAMFAEPLADDFVMINPDGMVIGKQGVVDEFGHIRGAVPEIAIEIRNFRLVTAGPTHAVAAYEEWQQSPVGNNSRHSTVVFTADPSARYGYRWRHLHETWFTRADIESIAR